MCWRSSTTNTHLEENWLMANNGKWHSHNILVSVSLGSPFVYCCLKGPVEAQSDQLLKVVAKSRETPPYCVICAQLCLLALSQKDTASADVTQEANHLMVLEAEAQSSVTFLLWTRGVWENSQTKVVCACWGRSHCTPYRSNPAACAGELGSHSVGGCKRPTPLPGEASESKGENRRCLIRLLFIQVRKSIEIFLCPLHFKM